MTFVRILAFSFALLGSALGVVSAASANDYRIGVHFWAGWRTVPGKPSPWDKIKQFPERKPLLGWYAEDDQKMMDQQLAWIKQYGLSYVVFAHGHDAAGLPDASHDVDTYLKSPERVGLPFAVMWADPTDRPKNEKQFFDVMTYILDHYLQQPDYFKLDGRPVLFIWPGMVVDLDIRLFGGDPHALFEKVQEMARQRGLKGIYLVAGNIVGDEQVRRMRLAGYDSVSTYNYHNAPAGAGHELSHSYQELDLGYRENWQSIADSKAATGLIVPMTVGWDRRAWGGTANDPLHDNSTSTEDEFRAHLEAAKSFMDAHWPLTQGLGVICCWNEFGEGSYIEPTEKWQFGRLETIQSVFGLKPRQ